MAIILVCLLFIFYAFSLPCITISNSDLKKLTLTIKSLNILLAYLLLSLSNSMAIIHYTTKSRDKTNFSLFPIVLSCVRLKAR